MPDVILVVEDELSLRETLVYNLNRQGYTVHSAADGATAVESARTYKPDLIILDLMLPVMDGFEVTRILRQEMNMPILMLTARDEEIDRVVGPATTTWRRPSAAPGPPASTAATAPTAPR